MKAPIAEILLAGPRGFCAGVERAIDIVEVALSVCTPFAIGTAPQSMSPSASAITTEYE